MNPWNYTKQYTISSTDCDASYEFRPSGIFSLLQNVIVEHAEQLQIARDDVLSKYNGFWMVIRSWVRFSRPIIWGETLTATTTVRRPDGKRLYWDCDFFIGDEPVGEATTLWVMANRSTHRSMSLECIEELPGTMPASAKTITLSRIDFPEEMALRDTRKLYYSDTDINGHISNTRYVALACDAAELNLRPHGVFVQELTMGYINECYADEVLQLYRCKKDGSLYIHGIGPAGVDKFDCKITMSSTEGL